MMGNFVLFSFFQMIFRPGKSIGKGMPYLTKHIGSDHVFTFFVFLEPKIVLKQAWLFLTSLHNDVKVMFWTTKNSWHLKVILCWFKIDLDNYRWLVDFEKLLFTTKIYSGYLNNNKISSAKNRQQQQKRKTTKYSTTRPLLFHFLWLFDA